MVAARPEVDTFGLVLPRVNLPHSGWPLDAQPCGSVASASTSAQPIGVSGQPSALAIGSGIASTSGVDVTLSDAGRHDIGLVLGGQVALQQAHPGRRGRRPDVRWGTVERFVPAGGQVRLSGAGSRRVDDDVDSTSRSTVRPESR